MHKKIGGRKAQLTIFIVMGLVLLIAAVFLFFLSSSKKGSEQISMVQASDSTQPVKFFVQDCLDNQLPVAIYKLGIHGGYMDPKQVYSGEFFDTNYLYYDDENIVPTISDMENSISSYLNSTLPEICSLENNSAFSSYDIETGSIAAKTKITDNAVLVDVDWPIIIKQGDDVKSIDRFSSGYNVDLTSMQSLVKAIVEDQAEDPDKLDILFLLREGYNITIVPEEDDFIYFIKDLDSEVFDEPFMFIFAARYG